MLYVLSQYSYSEDEAASLTNRKMLVHKKAEFEIKSRAHNLNSDEFFIKCCLEIDNSSIPFPNVLLDIKTGMTHSFDRVSGGVMALWLMYHYNTVFIFPSCYFGENCYRILIDISKDRDIYVYEDSGMFATDEFEQCTGNFTDFKTKEVVNCKDAFHYSIDKGY